jgi:hypothetical protein
MFISKKAREGEIKWRYTYILLTILSLGDIQVNNL